MKIFSFSNIGKRKENQDLVLSEKLSPENYLCVIADGMGGYSHGKIAAKIVVENILTYLSSVKKIDQLEIKKSINKANLAIKQQKQQLGEEMGATVGGIIINKDKVICFWLGDVQIFGYKKNKLFFQSESHSLINQLKKNNSVLQPDQISKYKHVVTRSVHGKIESSEVDFVEFNDFNKGDNIIICSDGVHDILDGQQIGRILTASNNLEKAVKEMENHLLIEANDNFSLLGIDL